MRKICSHSELCGDVSSEEIQDDIKLADLQNLQIGKTGIEKKFDAILRGKPVFKHRKRRKRKISQSFRYEGAGWAEYILID